jgi:hypothetical protein
MIAPEVDEADDEYSISKRDLLGAQGPKPDSGD